MNRIQSALCCLTLCCFAIVCTAAFPVDFAHAQNNRVALLTELSGTVELSRSGSASFERADWGIPLFEGDRLRTAASSQAIVLFANNNMMTVGAGNTFTISSGSTSSAASQPVSGAIISADADLTLHRAGQGEIEVLGGLRNSSSRNDLILDHPLNAKITSSQPEFSWSTRDDYEMYRVTIQTSSGVVWTTETTAQAVSYPDEAPILSPGETYFWRVEAEDMLDVTESSLTSFEIVSAEEGDALEAGLTSLQDMYDAENRGAAYHFLVGSLYAKHGVYGDAISAFEWIAESNSESASAHRILGNLYAEVGMKDAAIKSLQRAMDLTQEN